LGFTAGSAMETASGSASGSALGLALGSAIFGGVIIMSLRGLFLSKNAANHSMGSHGLQQTKKIKN